ncbi:MAG: class I SAM-dependent methyltransferase [Magnetococcales bacterium]|nr:class I SAM-dependent methyltransferase [Magnetococcales bacterium]MBF0148979.1 class I SAM-dependent methyltransferase [Magnetococcales bacterium]
MMEWDYTKADEIEKNCPPKVGIMFGIKVKQVIDNRNVGDYALADRQAINWKCGNFDLDSVLLQYVSPKQGMRLLDVACGNGHHTRLYAKKIGNKGTIVGIDQSASLIQDAIKAARQEELDLRYQVAFADPLPFEDNAFDVVTCNYALYHFEDMDGALSQMVRVLAPLGRIILTGPSSLNNQEIFDFHKSIGLEVSASVGRERFELGVRRYFSQQGMTVREEHYENRIQFESEREFANYYLKTRLFTDHVDQTNHEWIMANIERLIASESGQFLILNKRITLFEISLR